MSDGPHRSLPTRHGWKKVAERGANDAFAPEQVSEWVAPALEDDCRAEMTPQFLDTFYGLYSSLFRNQLEPELESLREMAGSGIGRIVLGHAIQLAVNGGIEPSAPLKAVTNALMDRAQRCSRQIEEHWLRKTDERQAQEVRARIDRSISQAAPLVEGLARKILKIESGADARPQKQDGLDDGVGL